MSKEEKTYEAINEKEFSDKIEEIVDQLHVQAASRDVVTDTIKEMSAKWGIKKPVIRKVASIIYKRSQEETENENEEVMDLVRIAQ